MPTSSMSPRTAPCRGRLTRGHSSAPPSGPGATRVLAMDDPGAHIPPAPAIDGAEHLHSGKVRDLYRLENGDLLMVASDRISAYDWVLSSSIPDKGAILTR